VGVGLTYYLLNPANQSQTQPVTISESELRSNLALDENENKYYWGFTAANGSAIGITDFVFAIIPTDAKYNLNNDVKDDQIHAEETTKGSRLGDKFIKSGSPVTFESTFTLQSAIQPFVFSSWEAQVDPIYYEIPEDQQIAVSYKVDDGIEKTANAIIDETGKI